MITKTPAKWRLFWQAVSGSCCSVWPGPFWAQNRVDLRSGLTPAGHQGGRNTCSVFAATGLMEYLIRQETGMQADLSESFNYWLGKSSALTTDYLRNLYRDMDGLAGFLAVEAYRHGSMLESEWPYDRQNWLQKQDPRCKKRADKASTPCYTGIPPQGAQRLRYGISPIYIPRERIGQFILKHKKPVVINVLWCQGAIDHKTGRIRMPTSSQVNDAVQHRRGHVILLVGYEAGTRTFAFRNSHGPDWGEYGYGTIPEDYIVNHCEVCPQLSRLGKANGEAVEFMRKAGMGVSGTLMKN